MSTVKSITPRLADVKTIDGDSILDTKLAV